MNSINSIQRSNNAIKGARILLAEDRSVTAERIKASLSNEGYEVLTVADGAEALLTVPAARPKLILINAELPKVSGLEVCRLVRRDPAFSGIPILILAGKKDEADSLMGLGLGADDFIAKPFGDRELVLRVRKLLLARPAAEPVTDEMAFEDLLVDVSRHEVAVQGRPVHLTLIEFNLLTLLAQRQGRVQSRERLLQDVWNYNGDALETRTVDSHMRRLRIKLGAARRHLETVRGLGYRFRENRERWDLDWPAQSLAPNESR